MIKHTKVKAMKMKLMAAALFAGTQALAQSGSFEYSYGGENYDTDASIIVPARDGGIISTAEWYNPVSADLSALIVHKLSSDGKLKWKTIVESSFESTSPGGIYELPDSSVVVSASVYNGGELSVQLIKLDKNGTLVTTTSFSNKAKTLMPATIIGKGDRFYTFAISSMGGVNATSIHKYDKNLNKLDSVSFDDVLLVNGTLRDDTLMLTGFRNSSQFPVLVRMDTGLTVHSAEEYQVSDPDFTFAAGTKVMVDDGQVALIGAYETSSGVSKRFIIYPQALANSMYVGGENIMDLYVRNRQLYVAGVLDVAVSGKDCFLAKFDMPSGVKKWVKGYGGSEYDEVFYMSVDGNYINMLGTTKSFSGRMNDKLEPVSEVYVVKADTNGNTYCSVDFSGELISFTPLTLTASAFTPGIISDDTAYSNFCTVVTPSFYDSAACASEPTVVIDVPSARLKVYPTITQGFVFVDNIALNEQCVAELINLNGQVLVKERLSQANNRINLSAVPEGMYLLRLTDKNGSVSVYKITRQS